MCHPEETKDLYGAIYAVDEAKQTAWGYILELLQLGVEITDAENNPRAFPGDIVVYVVYLEGALAGQATIIFDSNRQLKSITYE